MVWNDLSNASVLAETGKRLKEYRLRSRLTQQQLAEQAGISIFTVVQIERGKSVSFSLFLSVLRVLRLLDNMETLLPELGVSPIELLKLKGKTPKRVRRSGKK
jgi:transcriptional regulator with XRE-family HTH domain